MICTRFMISEEPRILWVIIGLVTNHLLISWSIQLSNRILIRVLIRVLARILIRVLIRVLARIFVKVSNRVWIKVLIRVPNKVLIRVSNRVELNRVLIWIMNHLVDKTLRIRKVINKWCHWTIYIFRNRIITWTKASQ